MAYYTSYRGRRALGARYAEPPEVTLDRQRMEQEYAMLPARAQLAEQKRQANLNQMNMEENRKQGATSGMLGTVGNLAGTAMLGKQMFGGSAAAAAPSAATAVAPGLTSVGQGFGSYGLATGGSALVNTGAAAAIPSTIAPVSQGIGMTSLAGGGTAAVNTGSAAGTTAASGATLGGAASAALTAAPYAAAGYLAAKVGGKLVEKAAGEGSSNVVSQFGRTVQNPLQGIGLPWMREIIKDDDKFKKVETVMHIFNPLGYLFKVLGL